MSSPKATDSVIQVREPEVRPAFVVEFYDLWAEWLAAGYECVVIAEISSRVCHVFPSRLTSHGAGAVMTLGLASTTREDVMSIVAALRTDVDDVWVTLVESAGGICVRLKECAAFIRRGDRRN